LTGSAQEGLGRRESARKKMSQEKEFAEKIDSTGKEGSKRKKTLTKPKIEQVFSVNRGRNVWGGLERTVGKGVRVGGGGGRGKKKKKGKSLNWRGSEKKMERNGRAPGPTVKRTPKTSGKTKKKD